MSFALFAGIIGAASEIAGLYESSLAEKAMIDQINIETKQKQLQLTQKKISTMSATEKLLKSQEAQMTTRGVGFGSPSFNAIQMNTLNISAKELQNINTEEEILDYNSKVEKDNARRSLHAKLFGDITTMGISFASLIKNL